MEGERSRLLLRNDEIKAPDSREARHPAVAGWSNEILTRFCRRVRPEQLVFVLPSRFSGAMGMLRIITEQRGSTFHLDLHGTVADEGVAILERHWRRIVDNVPSAVVRIGLSNVVFIDTHGERLLRRMAQCGVEFNAAGCMNRYVIERIEGGL